MFGRWAWKLTLEWKFVLSDEKKSCLESERIFFHWKPTKLSIANKRVRREVFILNLTIRNISRANGWAECWWKVEVSWCGSSWVANFRIFVSKDDSKKSRGDIGLAREEGNRKIFGCKSALTHNGKSFRRDRKKITEEKVFAIDRESAFATHIQRGGKLGKSEWVRPAFPSLLWRLFRSSSPSSSSQTKLFDIPETPPVGV